MRVATLSTPAYACVDSFTIYSRFLRCHYYNMAYFIIRFLWFFVILIGVTLFAYQVTDRIIVYYQRNTNVDVAVKYVPSVEFPSVTICNQNQFRYKNLLCLNCGKFMVIFLLLKKNSTLLKALAFLSKVGDARTFFYNFLRTSVLFMGLMTPLFGTGSVCSGF